MILSTSTIVYVPTGCQGHGCKTDDWWDHINEVPGREPKVGEKR